MKLYIKVAMLIQMRNNATRISKLLKTYPRTRPDLSAAHSKIYSEEYKINRSGQGLLYKLIKSLESWLHMSVARINNEGSILELGGGSLNHVPYESPSVIYDCVEPFQQLYNDSPYLNRIRYLVADLSNLSTEDKYARIISIAVLEHLESLPEIVARSALLLEDHGVFQAGIPTEGGLLWGLSWRLTTGLAYRYRTGLNYKFIMRHEHINNADEIEMILKYFFSRVILKRFPLPFYHLSFYTYLEATHPKSNRCNEYLKLLGTQK